MGNSSSAEEGLDDSINISHFKLLDVIGQGGFGKVRMIQKKDTKKKYALKYINKKFCIQKNAVEHIFRERILLEEISHPFITNLKFAFQDDEHMFMVLDLAVGGDLKYHLDQIGAFTERSVKLYAAEITCALIYLHSNSIIHRDIKPENILLDAKGHVHLTDFNVAICLKERIPSSRSGTSAYLAPEMLIKSKYSYSVDWWALGVTLFCLTYGKFPFFKTSTMSLSTAIKNGAFAFPTPNQIPPKGRSNFQESKLRNSFLKELLTVNISERLGSSDLSERDVRKHKWIADLDLGKILAFDYAADYIPSGFQNYDMGPQLQEFLYDGDALQAQPVKHKRKKTLLGAPKPLTTAESAIEKKLSLIKMNFIPYNAEHGNNREIPLPELIKLTVQTSIKDPLKNVPAEQLFAGDVLQHNSITEKLARIASYKHLEDDNSHSKTEMTTFKTELTSNSVGNDNTKPAFNDAEYIDSFQNIDLAASNVVDINLAVLDPAEDYFDSDDDLSDIDNAKRAKEKRKPANMAPPRKGTFSKESFIITDADAARKGMLSEAKHRVDAQSPQVNAAMPTIPQRSVSRMPIPQEPDANQWNFNSMSQMVPSEIMTNPETPDDGQRKSVIEYYRT